MSERDPRRKKMTWQAQFRNSAAVGAASELIACADLMARGYHVYRCESPAAPFDLVAYNGQEFLRVEVKTISSTNTFPTIAWPSNDEWDLLVAVGPNGCLYFNSEVAVQEVRNAIRAAYGHGPLKTASDLLPCGTAGAYYRHRSRKEEPCFPCREAVSNVEKARRAAAKAKGKTP